MTDAVYKWEIYCNDEAGFQYWWLDSDTVGPTTCPNDSGHSVNPNSVALVDSIENNDVRVLEEDGTIPTSGSYQMNSFCYMCGPGITTHTESFPTPISGLAVEYVVNEDNVGDEFKILVAPNTTIGVITADVSASDTVINVSSTVIDNMTPGRYMRITDGSTTNDLGRVVDVDTNLSQITVETAATDAFAAATPTYVQMTVQRAHVHIMRAWLAEFGSSKIGASTIPANTPIVLEYNNRHHYYKQFVVQLENLY
jgi:hypothetical protein